jgi:hypothetical protein
MMNWKESGMRLWRNGSNIPIFAWNDWGKLWYTWIRKVSAGFVSSTFRMQGYSVTWRPLYSVLLANREVLDWNLGPNTAWIFWGFSLIFSVHHSKCLVCISNWVTTISFHVFSDLLFTIIPSFRGLIICASDSFAIFLLLLAFRVRPSGLVPLHNYIVYTCIHVRVMCCRNKGSEIR